MGTGLLEGLDMDGVDSMDEEFTCPICVLAKKIKNVIKKDEAKDTQPSCPCS